MTLGAFFKVTPKVTLRPEKSLLSHFLKAEISLSGFWSKSLLENRGFVGGFVGGCFGGFFPDDFSKENGPKNPRKNPPRKPNTKIHE